jgi:hypothetical protein
MSNRGEDPSENLISVLKIYIFQLSFLIIN